MASVGCFHKIHRGQIVEQYRSTNTRGDCSKDGQVIGRGELFAVGASNTETIYNRNYGNTEEKENRILVDSSA